jgi:uncharacterized surface protein with fasciclin (FAS1) repeats
VQISESRWRFAPYSHQPQRCGPSSTLKEFSMASNQTTRKLASFGLALALSATSVAALADVMVGGAPMLPSKDIIDNAVNSKDHTTLVAAVKAAGLVDTLKGPGPFTVFAPTNAAFAALPAGTVDTLLKPENKGTLTTVLTYHVVAGKWDAAALGKMIKDGNGMASIKTVSGGTLIAKASGSKIMLTDEKGGTATVTIPDVYQSNGVIHVIDKVLLPK